MAKILIKDARKPAPGTDLTSEHNALCCISEIFRAPPCCCLFHCSYSFCGGGPECCIIQCMCENYCLDFPVQQRLLSRYPPLQSCFIAYYLISSFKYIGDPLYDKGISHWASSSTLHAKCVVEPGTSADVGIIVRTSLLQDHYIRKVNFTQAQYCWQHQNSFRSKSYRPNSPTNP